MRFTSNAPEGFVCKSFAGDDWKDCRDYVRQRLGLPDWEPGDEQDRRVADVSAWDRAHADAEARHYKRTEADKPRIERAQRLWGEASDPRGTIAELYLKSRALALPDQLAGPVLRFAPRCVWRNETMGQNDFLPCLIAAFTSISDDIITGISRIRIDVPERWPKTQRKMLGLVQGSAVKLAPQGERLAIGEGVETCMAAQVLGLGPAWALGSVGQISKFPVLDIEELVILGETGDANRDAARMCAQRYRKAGKRVRLAMPRVGSDMNDALMMGGAA